MATDIRVSSWSQLNDELYASSWQEHLGRFRSTYVYRGMTSVRYDLVSSLARLGNSPVHIEEHMLRAFRKYSRQDVLPDYSMWKWLALAQHHGLSTRLLDWTYSPLVAMHFATHDLECFDEDALIWCINYDATNDLLPDGLKKILHEEGSYVFTAEMLDRSAHTLRDFDALAPEPFVTFFEPPSLDERIVNQYALFSLMSDSNLNFAEWLEERPDVFRRIIIPAELKVEIRDKLDQANITERVLFPGLDGLSRWLNRYYTPRAESGPSPLTT